MLVTEFIRTTVIASIDKAPYTESELTLVVRLLTEWSTSQGLELTAHAVLARGNISRFIDNGLSNRAAATRSDYRSKLLRVAEALLPSELAPRRLTPLQSSEASAPYSSEEQRALAMWARSQTKARRVDARVLLALGMGAGLSSGEIVTIKTGDITPTMDGAVLVHVREGRPRLVPALRKWEKILLERSRSLSPDDFLFVAGRNGGGKNLITNFIARGDAAVHVQSQRLRSTWLVTQMSACTPLAELAEAAGVDSLEALTRYLPFVDRREPSESRRALRAA